MVTQDRSNKPLPDDEGASEDPDSGEDEPREEASGKFVQNPPEEKAASNKDRKKHNNIEKKSKKKARNTYQGPLRWRLRTQVDAHAPLSSMRG